jgi:hypothetical protein
MGERGVSNELCNHTPLQMGNGDKIGGAYGLDATEVAVNNQPLSARILCCARLLS